MLIVQQSMAGAGQSDLDFQTQLADEIDKDGRVQPVVWSLGDPYFRSKLDDGTIGAYISQPNDQQIVRAAGKLKADYLLLVQATQDKNGESVLPQAFLYRGQSSRTIWKYEQKAGTRSGKITVSENGVIDRKETARLQEKYSNDLLQGSRGMVVRVNGVLDMESTIRSLARTFAALLGEGPLKKHPPRSRNFTPEATGSLTFSPDMTALSSEPPTVQKAIEQANQRLENGNVRDAILTLRDAIDGNPLSPTPRAMLVQILMSVGKTQEAASEAERASSLIPDSADLWLSAAEAHVFLGDPIKSKNCLMEAQARGATSPRAHEIAGNIALIHGDYEGAQKSFGEAIVSGYNAAYLGRALTFALAGDETRCQEEILAYGGSSVNHAGQRYQMTLGVIDAIVAVIAKNLRDDVATLRVSSDPEIKARVTVTNQRANGLVTFIERMPVPESHQESHELRDLAHKLLAQSATELLAFANDGKESAAMESTISLTEAMGFFEAATATFNAERTN